MLFRHYRLLHFTLKRNLSEVYSTIFLRTFAASLVGLFVPIYLLHEINISFSDLMIYLMVVFTFLLLGYIIGALIGPYIGIRKLVALSVPFFISHYLLLYALSSFNIPILLIAILFGIGDGIFWFAYNIDFSKFSDKKHRGEEVKVWFVLASLIGIIGPFIGGFLLNYFNAPLLFAIVVILFTLSAIPLLKSKDVFVRYKISIKEVFSKENFENSHRYAVQGIRHVASGIFWPIFVFFLVKQYFFTGIIFSVAAIVSSIAIWFIGNEIDKLNRKVFSDFTSMIDGITSFTRIFISSFAQILTIAVLGGVTYGVSEIAGSTLAYDQANKTKIIGFIIYREVIFTLSRVIFLGIFLLSNLDYISSIKLSFILLGTAGFLQWLL